MSSDRFDREVNQVIDRAFRPVFGALKNTQNTVRAAFWAEVLHSYAI